MTVEGLPAPSANSAATLMDEGEVRRVPNNMPRNLREAIRDEELCETVDFLWQKAERFHARQTAPGASDNGRKHCLDVERNIFRIFTSAGRLEQFHDGALFLLSAAACCHDFDKGLPDQAKGELAHEMGFGDDPADLPHGPGSGRFTVHAHEALGLTEEQAEIVDLVVRNHNEVGDALRSALEDLHSRSCSFHGDLDVPALVTLLKLADALECHGRLRGIDVAAALTRAEEAPGDGQAQLQAGIAVFRKRAREWFINGNTCILPVSPRSLDEVADCRACFQWLHEKEFSPLTHELQRLGLPWKLELDINADYLDVPAPRVAGATSALPGLYSYGPADADILCGRDEDIEAVLGLVEHYRYSAVIGPSGAGKSSLIAAGVIPMFENLGRPWVLTRPDPAAGALFRPSDFCEALGWPVGDEGLDRLCAELQSRAGDKPSLVVIDQFEDIAYHGLFDADSVFGAINEARFRAPTVHFLFSYRDDAHARLLPICELLAGSPAGLPAHGVRPLGLADARDALVALLARADLEVPADVLDTVADSMRDISRGAGDTDSVYPPFIQMMAALVTDLASDGPVTPERYKEAVSDEGGAKPGVGIVDRYLDAVLEDLRQRHGLDAEGEANPILIALSRTTGERAQVTIGEAASLSSVEPSRVAKVLPWLRAARLVRELADGRWEIAHDFLARCISENRMSPAQRRKRAVVETLRHRARNYEHVHELLTENELRELFLQRNVLREHLAERERDLVLYSGLGAWGPFCWASPCDSRSLLEIALDAATDEHAGVRAAAARILGALGSLEDLELLAGLGDDDDEDVFNAAHSAIERLLGDCDQERLAEFVVHDSAVVRSLAAEAMGARGDSESLITLKALTADTHRAVRCSAARAIGSLGAATGLDALTALASDKDWRVREAAAKAIGALGGPEGLEPLRTLAGDEDADVREAVAYAIGSLSDAAGLVALRELAGDEDRQVRCAAAVAIESLGDAAGLDALRELAGDEDPQVRCVAADALGAIGSPHTIMVVSTLVRDEDWRVRMAVVKALTAHRALGLDALKALAEDENSFVRRAAAGALEPRGAPQDLATLRAMAEDEDPDMRMACRPCHRVAG